MKYIFSLSLFGLFLIQVAAQSPHDSSALNSLKKTVTYLSDDKLQGRRTGTAGEKAAYEYIRSEFISIGLLPLGSKDYLQPFEVKGGKVIEKGTSLLTGGKAAELHQDFFPLSYSANTTNTKIRDNQPYRIAYLNLTAFVNANKNNPHFTLRSALYDSIKSLTGPINFVLVHDLPAGSDSVSFEPKDDRERLSVPVICWKKSSAITLPVTLTVDISQKQTNGHNVIGFWDNKAPSTIVIGAHYDHLGFGEDHNSLYTGSTPMVHNGADDNASGVGAMLALASWVKQSGLKNYNYAFIAFSGEELGLFGSKYFVEHSPIDLASINYMINLDMVGRLNDSTKAITIGGYGTSPAWSTVVSKVDQYLTIKFDSSGTGPSDHTSFYRKDIPVLFFFTGVHSDYHKPSDDADKINYAGALEVVRYIKSVISATDSLPKISFSKTREITMGKSSFKVTLGIMPDYTYSGNGVRVDGVSENRPAQKAGIKTGDVLTQLGEHSFSDVEGYMKALNKFNKGDTTTVKLKRGNEELRLPIVF